jgi:uncharacterized protein
MNIISLDGGGIFGLITAVVLDRIEAECPGAIAKADMFVGTSIGGIMSLILANGHSTKNLIEICGDPKSFLTKSEARSLASRLGLCAYYNDNGRKKVLSRWLGDKTLGDLDKYVAIHSFKLDGPAWNSAVFHNIPGDSDLAHSRNMPAIDAGMATSAAPMYFPSYGHYVDGGVTANNPAMTAIALTQDRQLNWKWAGSPLQDIKVFSVGRTYAGDEIDRMNFDGGWGRWLPMIVEILSTGNQSMVSYQAQQLLGDNFFRHTRMVPSNLNGELDDCSKAAGLRIWAENLDLTQEIEWFKEKW